MGSSKGSPKREEYCHAGLPQKIRKISSTQPNLTLKRARKRTIKEVSKRREIIKIRAERKDIETKKQPQQNPRTGQ